jgi:hypothetical protein
MQARILSITLLLAACGDPTGLPDESVGATGASSSGGITESGLAGLDGPCDAGAQCASGACAFDESHLAYLCANACVSGGGVCGTGSGPCCYPFSCTFAGTEVFRCE